MNRTTAVASTIGLLVATGGCSTLPSPGSDHGIDTEKVAQIERNARANGIDVHWIRYPQRPPAPVDPVAPRALPSGT